MSQVDTQLQASAQLGLYYAEKLRGAAHLARYLFGGPDKEQKESVAHLESALEAWRGVVAATENHYVAHEIWLFGQFHWKQYLPEVENDIRIARDARRFAPGSTLALDGMHEWLEYTYGLLGHKPVDAINTAAPVAITPPMARHEDPTAPLGYYFSAAADLVRVGNTITGAKPSASGANSATFAVELPADGEYSVAMDCWWPKAAGSLSVFVDESATASDGYTLRVSTKTASGAWTRMTLGHTVLLGAGGHTVRIFAPSPGVRIGRVVVNWVGKP
jgi:hypothetical protein